MAACSPSLCRVRSPSPPSLCTVLDCVRDTFFDRRRGHVDGDVVIAAVRNGSQWGHGQVSFGAGTLFGVLAVQLALVVAGVGGPWFICKSCRTAFQRTTGPRPGEAAYCKDPDCKRRARAAASRAYLSRVRSGAPMPRGGLGPRSRKQAAVDATVGAAPVSRKPVQKAQPSKEP